MTPAEIEAALRVAFDACDAEGYPLSLEQQSLLLQLVAQQLDNGEAWSTSYSAVSDRDKPRDKPEDSLNNPLDALTIDQRRAFLDYVQEAQASGRSWKAQLLNDWLRGNDSGPVQFVRDQFGLNWLEQVRPVHLAAYAEAALRLKVGDRIEVANSLWEWVQDDGPCSREWFPCTVISVNEPAPRESANGESASSQSASSEPETTGTSEASEIRQASCCVRFDNGMEYEIQGIYEWNRYNWRWAGEESRF
ncbi:hypothetical protein HNI00_06445 [Thermoleptolyngbya oregonensis NK1-22]|uniref:Uncharacterized protein n=1 Tax=Thermoleptolyngbya oregonensis NK1-22 TaxID=2547457 RepID=A0AA96Y330_9CYAN|nr:hypothetical protein [Thermoleptolyngbya oregonensis]WOB42826.1 hypothetical protein HNI00_06445 [Thermoleptolyngbya oregonensis NK1-22]